MKKLTLTCATLFFVGTLMAQTERQVDRNAQPARTREAATTPVAEQPVRHVHPPRENEDMIRAEAAKKGTTPVVPHHHAGQPPADGQVLQPTQAKKTPQEPVGVQDRDKTPEQIRQENLRTERKATPTVQTPTNAQPANSRVEDRDDFKTNQQAKSRK